MPYVIDFIPPIDGIGGEFNTIRVGSFYAKRLKAGDTVFLMNKKERLIIGAATVIGVETAPLIDICIAHGNKNHTQIAGCGIPIMQVIEKIYGPHIAMPHRNATVVHLKRVLDEETYWP